MKKLIIKPNCIKQKDENVEKIIEQWTSGSSVVVVPPGYDVEVVDDGRNEVAIYLDQEIEKRKAAVPKAAVEDSRKFKICNRCWWDEYRDGYHPNGNPCDSCILGKNFSPKNEE